jgi:DNA recombination protein RmuC
VSTYNQAVGSLESRVLVSARRLNQLGVVESDLEPPQPVEQTTRALSAPELVAESVQDGPELVATPPARLTSAPEDPTSGRPRRLAGS